MELKKEGFSLINKISNYLKETEIEGKKVVWPDRKYVGAATLIVLVIVILSVLYVMALDFGFAKIFEFLTYTFKAGI